MLGEFDETKAGEVELMIAEELKVGATAEEIEEFFEKHDITHSYDEFSQRYQAIIRDVPRSSKANHAIIIYIYVNDQMRLQEYEVEDSFR
ncbi:hypothetical protein GCM10009754_88500 [Amycolatopsis minnesotensis]|uniref:Uncharacterized protein n=1 Tax=Amycolatopsis minnesotensis TaxID=337894 RepID=A0ABN2T1E3_9PSEU